MAIEARPILTPAQIDDMMTTIALLFILLTAIAMAAVLGLVLSTGAAPAPSGIGG